MRTQQLQCVDEVLAMAQHTRLLLDSRAVPYDCLVTIGNGALPPALEASAVHETEKHCVRRLKCAVHTALAVVCVTLWHVHKTAGMLLLVCTALVPAVESRLLPELYCRSDLVEAALFLQSNAPISCTSGDLISHARAACMPFMLSTLSFSLNVP